MSKSKSLNSSVNSARRGGVVPASTGYVTDLHCVQHEGVNKKKRWKLFFHLHFVADILCSFTFRFDW